MNKWLGCLVCVSLVLGGCGKKKKDKKNDKMAQVEMYDDSAIEEYAFDDSVPTVEELAFMDEDGDYLEDEDMAFAENELDELEDEADLLAQWEGDDSQLEFTPIQFGFDSDLLSRGQEENLEKDIELARLAVDEGNKVVLDTFACQVGNSTYNLALTQRRAESLKKRFIAAGIPADSIEAVGRGQECHLVWSDQSERIARIRELAPNRRAELSVIADTEV